MSDALLLRQTFEIAVNDPRFGALFYERLFRQHPNLAPLFKRNSDGAQQKMFAQKLAAIVDAVEDADALRAELEAIARSHATYGVTPEMYDWVGAVLIETLREAAADEWSADAERAWRSAYGVIVGTILAQPAG
jgi:hemoglobin-like flavoprotein